MNITLRNYQSFDLTKAITNYGRTTWNEPLTNCIDLCRKVGAIALTILGLLPAILSDLALIPLAKAYRACNPASPNIFPGQPPVPPPQIGPVPVPQQIRPGVVPTPQQVNQLMEHPYPFFPFGINHVQFFRDALRQAFVFNEPDKRVTYQNLIEEDDPGEIDIYSWTAGCLLAHYLRSKVQSDRADQLFPKVCPPPANPLRGNAELARLQRNQQNADQVDRLRQQYHVLSREEKASVLLQIMVPQTQWQLTRRAEKLVNDIRAAALAITQNNDYNVQIYRPAVNQIDNILNPDVDQ